MSKPTKNITSSMWVSAVTLGILACLGGVFYTFFIAQKEAGQESEYRVLANDMRLVQQGVVVKARETARGDAATRPKSSRHPSRALTARR
mgnify:CR=1 FL=1